MSTFTERLFGAAKLRPQIYEEVESDKTALPQAMVVVLLSSLAAGIGTLTRGGPGGLFFGLIAALVSWYFWAFLTYIIGTKLLPEPQTRSDVGELLRTTGFSSSPGIIRVFGIIPGLTGILFFVASIWMLVAMVIAVRQALDYTSTFRAVGVCVIGWIIQGLVLAFMFALAGGTGRL
jgi:hypothetical protein